MAGERAIKKSRETINNLRGDYGNIAFLLLLYVLQGIPIGLSSAVPLLLQNRKVSYSDQALFSFVTWPFSLKLLWAPIVDSVFWRRVGRRKSWLIPVQMAIGIFMLILSGSVNNLLLDDPAIGKKPNIHLMTFIFLMLNFLAATQDIAVDGWALTMLSRRNVGYASTCNTVGQTAGFFIGNVIFLALESADFTNKYLRYSSPQPYGIVTFEQFLYYCGIVFIVITTLVAIFKSENKMYTALESNDDDDFSIRLTKRKISDAATNKRFSDTKVEKRTDSFCDDGEESEGKVVEKDLSVMETYSLLGKIMNLASFKLFAVVLLTCKIGFSAPEAVSGLKLVEAGVHKENLALLAVPMVPLQIFLPWYLSRITCGPRPLDLYLKAFPYRLLFGIVFPMVVHLTPSMKQTDGTFPGYYYLGLILVYALNQITVYAMFVSLMAFHASVSDPSIGGTYMTLFNTITNLGGNWPATTSLWLVDKLTLQDCKQECAPSNQTATARSSISNHSNPAIVCHDSCTTLLDGYYIECAICVVVGFAWLQWGRGKLRRIQSLPPVAWSVSQNKTH